MLAVSAASENKSSVKMSLWFCGGKVNPFQTSEESTEENINTQTAQVGEKSFLTLTGARIFHFTCFLEDRGGTRNKCLQIINNIIVSYLWLVIYLHC